MANVPSFKVYIIFGRSQNKKREKITYPIWENNKKYKININIKIWKNRVNSPLFKWIFSSFNWFLHNVINSYINKRKFSLSYVWRRRNSVRNKKEVFIIIKLSN